jgi:hypothetical protein
VKKKSPGPALSDAEFNAALGIGGCRYFYLLAARSPSYPQVFYPRDRLQGRFEVVEITALDDGTGGQNAAGMLVRLKDHRQKGS